MPTPPPPQGLFGLPDFGDIASQLTKLLPGVVDQFASALPPNVTGAIKDTIGGILGDGPINIGDPQPPGERPIPITPDQTDVMATTMQVLDAAIAALNVLTKLDFLVPKQYQDILTKLQGALTTVRKWLN